MLASLTANLLADSDIFNINNFTKARAIVNQLPPF